MLQVIKLKELILMNRLLKGFCPNLALHKEMLAVLAAVTEVIKINGGKETTVEYLGALVSVVQQ
jgi:ribosomal RNA-processing protein 12